MRFLGYWEDLRRLLHLLVCRGSHRRVVSVVTVGREWVWTVFHSKRGRSIRTPNGRSSGRPSGSMRRAEAWCELDGVVEVLLIDA